MVLPAANPIGMILLTQDSGLYGSGGGEKSHNPHGYWVAGR
jgi:hypothetical protein